MRFSIISIMALLMIALLIFSTGCERKVVYENDDQVSPGDCFVCHGEVKYTLEDIENDRSAIKRMAPCKVVDRDKYYSSVHKSFSCTDCHSYDFMTFPHSPGVMIPNNANKVILYLVRCHL